MNAHDSLVVVEERWIYPDVDRLLRRARQASARLWGGRRDDGAAQVIDELVARLEEARRDA